MGFYTVMAYLARSTARALPFAGTLLAAAVLAPADSFSEVRCAGKPVVWSTAVNARAASSQPAENAELQSFVLSRQQITAGDGCVSFTARDTKSDRIAGLASPGILASAQNFQAAFHLKKGGKYSLVVAGVEIEKTGTFHKGARFLISSHAGKILFRKNGRLVYSSSAAPERVNFGVLKSRRLALSQTRIASGKCRKWLVNGRCSTPAPTNPTPVPPTRRQPTPPPSSTSVPAGPPTSAPTRIPTIAPTNPAPAPTATPVSGTPAPTATATPSPITGTVYYVSPSGSDSNNGSSTATPWKTVARALSAAASNSTVLIRSGTYTEALSINRSNITLQGYPGDTKPVITYGTGGDTSTILIGTGASYVTLRDLNISGGYYNVKFDSSWSNGGSGTGPHHITIDGCLMHDSASHAVKIQPKANYILIQNSEIHHPGRRSGLEGQGIDAVNAANFTFQNNYIHDTPHVCLFTKGGAVNSLVQRNLMVNCGWSGILLGQDTGRTFMDSASNPNLYECINCTARNNVVINTGYAGIGSYSASGTKIYNNTILNSSSIGQAGIFLSAATVGHSGTPGVNYDIRGNIIVMNPAYRQALAIAPGAYTGTPLMNNNIYYSSGGAVTFVDNRSGGTRTLAAWQSATGQDANSVEANPALSAPQLNGYDVSPGAGSPASGFCPNLSSAGYAEDYYGNGRPAGAWDCGAVER